MTDFHLHTPLCRHATGTPAEYARAAVEKGLREIGFADHSPMPRDDFDDWRMPLRDLPRYVEMVQEARELFPALPIRLGLECDFIAGHEGWIEQLAGMADWDFFIGSVHYIGPGWDVDNPRHLSRFSEYAVEEIWDRYWREYESAIRSGLFDFMAHPDLPKKFGHRPAGDLRRWHEPAIAALAEKNVAFEINTAGLRKPVGEAYPSRGFLALARAADVPLLINSDAHSPAEVGADFDRALLLAREAGFSGTVSFEKRRRIFHPLDGA